MIILLAAIAAALLIFIAGIRTTDSELVNVIGDLSGVLPLPRKTETPEYPGPSN